MFGALAVLLAAAPLRGAAHDGAGDAPARADADSTLAAAAAVVEPPAGGDVRRVRGGGVEDLVGAAPGLRAVASGWRGYRASVARGTFPASFTELTLRGRWLTDWLDGGVDLTGAAATAEGRAVVESGPDLSAWPAWTAEWPRVSGGCAGPARGADALTIRTAAPLSVDLTPLRRPGSRPFARLTALTGPFSRTAFAAEFSRRYEEGGRGLTGYLESDAGNAPSGSGAFEVARSGGAVLLSLSGGWAAEFGGTRSDCSRSALPGAVRGFRAPTASDEALGGRRVASDVFARLVGRTAHVEIFHSQTWSEPRAGGAPARSDADGLAVMLTDVGPLSTVRLQLERLSARGALLTEGRDALGARAEFATELTVGRRELTAVGGVNVRGGDAFPLARAALSQRLDPSHGSWALELGLAGRHATVVETSLAPWELSAGGGGPLVEGAPELAPERAAYAAGTLVRTDIMSGVGVTAEVVRTLDPIVVRWDGGEVAAPMNAPDETGGAVAVWAAAGDSSRLAARLDARYVSVAPDGALNALAPVPALSLRASLSVPCSLFDDYLRTRLAVRVVHESGLARGPWSGLLDDSRTSVSLAATGEAGSARLFVVLDDVLGGDGGRLPGTAPGSARLTAGFSWLFRD